MTEERCMEESAHCGERSQLDVQGGEEVMRFPHREPGIFPTSIAAPKPKRRWLLLPPNEAKSAKLFACTFVDAIEAGRLSPSGTSHVSQQHFYEQPSRLGTVPLANTHLVSELHLYDQSHRLGAVSITTVTSSRNSMTTDSPESEQERFSPWYLLWGMVGMSMDPYDT